MAVDSGHPMGPLELIDLVGLEVALHVLTSLAVLGPRIECRDSLLRAFLAGDKPVTFWSTGHENPRALELIRRFRGSDAGATQAVSDDVLHQRLFLPMIDEAVRCLNDKIVDHSWQVDFALIYGTGFPAFRGGLLTWARESMAPTQIAEALHSLAERYGKRFEPCPGLSHGGW